MDDYPDEEECAARRAAFERANEVDDYTSRKVICSGVDRPVEFIDESGVVMAIYSHTPSPPRNAPRMWACAYCGGTSPDVNAQRHVQCKCLRCGAPRPVQL